MNDKSSHTKETESLTFTGERFVPEVHGNIELEHLHRYLQACEIASNKVVLDIASGEGYGSNMLANYASKVIGVDISPEAVEHARKRYQKPNLEYLEGSCAAIPLPDASVDMVVSYETIEHHDQHDEMMKEIQRVLRPNGLLLISSPDRYFYSDEPNYSNPYHVKELYEDEFKQLLAKHFAHSVYFGQRILYGSAILAESASSPCINYRHENGSIKAQNGLSNPIYWIALASNGDLPNLSSGVFDQPINDTDIVQSWCATVTERDTQINHLEQVIAEHKQKLSDSKVEIERHEQLSQSHQSQLLEITQSNSWRITAPLRKAHRCIKKILKRIIGDS